MGWFETLTPDLASHTLARAGFRCAASELHLEVRDERWLVRMPGEHLSWFAASAEGARRLQTERRVLRLLQRRCSFLVPRVIHESASGEFDVRVMVPGVCDPWSIYAEARENKALAAQLGDAIGKILAEQHCRIHAADVEGWLPLRPSWPERSAWVRERLGRVVDDVGLVAEANAVMDAYESMPVSESERALVHTDVGFHNLGIDPGSRVVHGIFDYDGAAWADRHHDFRYLVFDFDRYDLLDAALSIYEPLTGHNIQRERVFSTTLPAPSPILRIALARPPGSARVEGLW